MPAVLAWHWRWRALVAAPLCVFVDVARGAWSGAGCAAAGSGAGAVTCACNHLTEVGVRFQALADEQVSAFGAAPALLAEPPGAALLKYPHLFAAIGAISGSSAALHAPRVAVVDTVGAGDTFWGNCVADWVLGHSASTEATLRSAMQAAAINCTRAGCQPPRWSEVQAFASGA
jgi:hypothetical protein